MNSLVRSKSGSLQDLLLIVIVLIFFGLIILIGFRVMSAINTGVASVPGMDADSIQASQDITNSFTGVVDNGFLLLTIGLGLITLVLAALVRVHPIFIPFFLIALVFLILFSGVASNIYQEVAETSEMTVYADQLTFTSNILTYLPFIIGGFGTILMIVMYKLRSVALE